MTLYYAIIHISCTTIATGEPMDLTHDFTGVAFNKDKAIRLADEHLTKWANNKYLTRVDVDGITIHQV